MEVRLQARTVEWVGSSLDDLRAFPEDVRTVVGYALYLAQLGDKHPRARPLRGFSGAGVLEIVDDFDGDTSRAAYTVRFSDAVYVLHAFQKKASRGIATQRQEIELIRQRLRQAAAVFGIDQPKVSALLSGGLRGFSMDRLLRFLTLLGQDVEIRITPPSNAGGPTRIRVASAAPVDETNDVRVAAIVASTGATDRRAP